MSTAFERLMYGGFGYGKMCIPAGLGELILTILLILVCLVKN